jgi:hypothetical protein
VAIKAPRRVTATEFSRNVSDLLGQVLHRRTDLEVTKGGEVIARVLPPAAAAPGFPIDQLDDLMRRLPRLGAVEGDAFLSDIHAARDRLSESEDAWES